MKKRKFRELRRKAAEAIVEKEIEQEIEIEEEFVIQDNFDIKKRKPKKEVEEDESFIDID